MTVAGYIVGFPGDTKESILRDVEIIKRELPLDIIEFFMLTPLPGSEDHKVQLGKGTWMDPDLNKYDLNHRVSHHPKMSDAEWDEAYWAAWKAFYSPEHCRTVLRRAAANKLGRVNAVMSTLLWFDTMIPFEGLHPLEGGLIRLKFRRDRRPGLPIESPFVFYPRCVAETVRKLYGYAQVYWRLHGIRRKVVAAPDRWTYTDVATAPPQESEFEALDLYHATRGGEAALARKQRADAIRAGVHPASHAPHCAALARSRRTGGERPLLVPPAPQVPK